jgi:hypothetical protein
MLAACGKLKKAYKAEASEPVRPRAEAAISGRKILSILLQRPCLEGKEDELCKSDTQDA